MKLVDIEHISCANAITHSGVFHADEVLATAILDRAVDDLVVCRIPHMVDGISGDAIVYDIGQDAYDHHQRGGNGCRANGIPYASAGLIWRAFGMRVVGASHDPAKARRLIDRDLVQGVDAADNGISTDGDSVGELTFSRIVSLLMPVPGGDSCKIDDAFCRAVNLAGEILDCMIAHVEARLGSQMEVESAIAISEGHILELSRGLPWQETLFESKCDKADDVYFVVFPSARGGYNWQCVPTGIGSKKHRFSVPRSWWGLGECELRKETGVDDAVFCHPSGFIGGAKSLFGAREMLYVAMRLSDNS